MYGAAAGPGRGYIPGMRFRLAVAAALLLGIDCSAAINYPSAGGPRYAEPAPDSAAGRVDSIRIVTFNIQWGRHVSGAIEALTTEPGLRRADIVLLQEMDAPGATAIANALGLGYVYYPATVYPSTHRDFGEAVLSRWPIVADRRIVLPHRGRIMHTEREAVAVTVLAGGRGGVPVRVYCLHLGTLGDVGPGARRDQIHAVLQDADQYPIAIVGGDFNSGRVPNQALAHGFAWPTREGPRTATLGRIDHILVKGLVLPDSGFTGTGSNLGASDHRPVWLVVRLPQPPATDSVR